jgi:acetyltransferase-like isoleucine patch superfamily enzyme
MITRLVPGIASRCRAMMLRWRGAHLPGPVWLRAIEVPRQAHRLALGTGVALDRGVVLLVSGEPSAPTCIRVGDGAYVNRWTIIDAVESIVIGADCMIGPYCYITDHDHQRSADGRPAGGPLKARPVTIGRNVWMGAHASVLKGVAIGDGATIGAGAVVTRDVAAGATVAGNPARPLRGS